MIFNIFLVKSIKIPLTEMRTSRQAACHAHAKQNRLRSALPPIPAAIQAHITWLDAHLATLDDALDTALPASPVFLGVR
jgi:hypothetical protein